MHIDDKSGICSDELSRIGPPAEVFRCYVEKKPGFDVAATAVQTEIADILDIDRIRIRIFNRYDVQNLPKDVLPSVMDAVFSEPMCDNCYEEQLPPVSGDAKLLCVEPLPGQFDPRADSCEQCIQMLIGGERPIVRTAQIYAIEGIDENDFRRIKEYLINPLASREAPLGKPEDLHRPDRLTADGVPTVEGFEAKNSEALDELILQLGLAMSLSDLLLIQAHYRDEKRDPSIAELRVIDTYWSDHCRHTTFNTVIKSADIQDERVQRAYDSFLAINDGKPVTLMRMATAAMRFFSGRGRLPMLDVSDEINACTVHVKADFEHGQEDWLVFFKNETHNHPTEIEPFGGASTCIGGAIRDPLSGRAYVYQGMRITGAGDPRKPIGETLPGKIPQRKLTVTAAEGFSSYGNQIGLATGFVKELYHEGYVAKRLEAGAVVGAAPLSSVRRGIPEQGDAVVLLGGRTGKDGIGGATGSSKIHGMDTVSESASEVQMGNALEERKLQRLFRNPDVTRLIKKCNDFGAGGASVAIGELADGVEIDLDAFPVKYDGLSGIDLAISESQERMAAVVSESDLKSLLRHAEAENIEASVVARVTGPKRLAMLRRGQKIVDIDRRFLDTNGALRQTSVYVPPFSGGGVERPGRLTIEKIKELVGDLSFCSQKGLVERFDSSIGAASLFAPFGGKYASTETQVMAALLPGTGARTASVMAYGFDPHYTEADPFGGSAHAVVTSVAKLVASGVKLDTIHLSLQEFFPRTNDDETRWGLPFSALLGAFSAQMGLKVAAIGGKDSMSGSFGDLDVPPTLISFAFGISDASQMISPEFKGAGHPVYLLETPLDEQGLPNYEALRAIWEKYAALCRDGKILSAWACETGGVCGGIIKMCFGNMIGFSGCAGNGADDGTGDGTGDGAGDGAGDGTGDRPVYGPLNRQWGSILI